MRINNNSMSIFRRLLALRQGVSWFVILLVAAGLRLISLDQSLWLDEAIEWWAVKSFGLRELLTGYMVGDFNPPGHHVLMWFWVRFFGDSEIALRMPAVIFGVGIVWWVYRIASLLRSDPDVRRGRTFPEFAAGMAAVNGLLIYYSQEARMYAMAAFFAAGAMYFFMKGEKEEKNKKDRKDYLLYLLFMAAAMYSHYLTWLMLPFLAIWGLRYVLPVLVTVPWWPMLVKQLSAGMAAAVNPVWAELSRTNFKNLALVAVKFVTGRVPWPETAVGQVLVGGAVLAFWVAVIIGVIRVISPSTRLTLRRRPPASRSQRASVRGSDVPADFLAKIRVHPKNFGLILVLWAFGPLALGGLIGLIIPVFTYFRFLFVAPAVMILAAMGVNQLARLGKFAKLGTLGVMLIFSGWYLLIPGNHREDWKGAVGELRRMDEMPVVIIHPAVKPPFDYYDKGESIVIPLRIHLALRQGESSPLRYIPYAQPIFDPEDTVRKDLSSLGYLRDYERHFRGVTLERWVNYESIAHGVF